MDKQRCIDCKDYGTCVLRARPVMFIPPADWPAEFARLQREAAEVQPACKKEVR